MNIWSLLGHDRVMRDEREISPKRNKPETYPETNTKAYTPSSLSCKLVLANLWRNISDFMYEEDSIALAEAYSGCISVVYLLLIPDSLLTNRRICDGTNQTRECAPRYAEN